MRALQTVLRRSAWSRRATPSVCSPSPADRRAAVQAQVSEQQGGWHEKHCCTHHHYWSNHKCTLPHPTPSRTHMQKCTHALLLLCLCCCVAALPGVTFAKAGNAVAVSDGLEKNDGRRSQIWKYSWSYVFVITALPSCFACVLRLYSAIAIGYIFSLKNAICTQNRERVVRVVCLARLSVCPFHHSSRYHTELLLTLSLSSGSSHARGYVSSSCKRHTAHPHTHPHTHTSTHTHASTSRQTRRVTIASAVIVSERTLAPSARMCAWRTEQGRTSKVKLRGTTRRKSCGPTARRQCLSASSMFPLQDTPGVSWSCANTCCRGRW